MNMSKHKKIHIYAQLMPYNLKMALAFFPEETINDVQFFIEETMKKYRSKYRIGRIEKKSNSAWLLPQYKIYEFLQDEDEIVVYTCEYGLTKAKLASSVQVEDIDIGFIGKKSRRSKQGDDDNKSKDSNSGGVVLKKSDKDNKGQQSVKKDGKGSDKKRKRSESEEDDDDEKEKFDNNEQSEEDNEEEVSSDSGDDKDEDLNV